MFERRLGCPKIGCAVQDIRHQMAAIDIVLPVFNRALREAQRAANVSSFQGLAAIPQVHLMRWIR